MFTILINTFRHQIMLAEYQHTQHLIAKN